jgi:hypothetical protein
MGNLDKVKEREPMNTKKQRSEKKTEMPSAEDVSGWLGTLASHTGALPAPPLDPAQEKKVWRYKLILIALIAATFLVAIFGMGTLISTFH